jgi:hypothetical protein
LPGDQDAVASRRRLRVLQGLVDQHAHQDLNIEREGRIVWAECLLVDGQRPPDQGLGLGAAACRAQDLYDEFELRRGRGVVGSTVEPLGQRHRLVCLCQSLVVGAGLIELKHLAVELEQVVVELHLRRGTVSWALGCTAPARRSMIAPQPAPSSAPLRLCPSSSSTPLTPTRSYPSGRSSHFAG